MDQRELSMDLDGPWHGGLAGGDDGTSGTNSHSGTLHLVDGRHIAVLRLIHVGEVFLFFSHADGPHAQVIRRDEIRSWESANGQPKGTQP